MVKLFLEPSLHPNQVALAFEFRFFAEVHDAENDDAIMESVRARLPNAQTPSMLAINIPMGESSMAARKRRSLVARRSTALTRPEMRDQVLDFLKEFN